MKKDEAVIIHGAAGGVGSLALQFAKMRGARVLATASGNDGLAFVRGLCADIVLDGRHGDIVSAARGFAPGGVDTVLALAGGEALEAALTRSEMAADWPIRTASSPSQKNGPASRSCLSRDHRRGRVRAAWPRGEDGSQDPDRR